MQQRGVDARSRRHARAGAALLIDASFDPEILALLDAEREVRIETIRPDGTPRSTIIWAVVDRDDVFVRSWKGDRGHWYQAALDAPDQVALVVGKSRLPVRVLVAADDDSIDRCSRALERKYAGDPSTPTMVRPYNLATTLRIVPR